MSRTNNDRKISKAFNRLLKAKDDAILNTLRMLMPMAVENALFIHDADHPLHLEIGDTYGWAIIRNGQLLDMEVTSGETNEGYTAEAIRQIASTVRSSGWVGLVVAGMGDNANNYYSQRYEINILQDTISFTESQFKSTFNIRI